MAELDLPSHTILSLVSQEHMPRDRDASNPVVFDPVPPTGSVAVLRYISAESLALTDGSSCQKQNT